jgi:hypothetical protein
MCTKHILIFEAVWQGRSHEVQVMHSSTQASSRRQCTLWSDSLFSRARPTIQMFVGYCPRQKESLTIELLLVKHLCWLQFGCCYSEGPWEHLSNCLNAQTSSNLLLRVHIYYFHDKTCYNNLSRNQTLASSFIIVGSSRKVKIISWFNFAVQYTL